MEWLDTWHLVTLTNSRYHQLTSPTWIVRGGGMVDVGVVGGGAGEVLIPQVSLMSGNKVPARNRNKKQDSIPS